MPMGRNKVYIVLKGSIIACGLFSRQMSLDKGIMCLSGQPLAFHSEVVLHDYNNRDAEGVFLFLADRVYYLLPFQRRMWLKGSLSFKGRDLESSICDQSTSATSTRHCEQGDSRHHAALRLQKVYRSFRTRRKLADCAVVVEQKWWKVLDFAELKLSSISFFDVEGSESAISRWSRARTRAAK
ncbi:hypothetical protein Droror1_Dr00002249, partial [Drosera rotundifolia]